MRVLVLGGTVFLGRHVVDAALARGDDVTLFHRGRHPSHRPDDVDQVLGDRTADLALLTGRRFDAVVDTCGYVPADVAASATLLDTAHYTYVSSGSAYADPSPRPLTEDAPAHDSPGDDVTEVDDETYGPLKAGCERAVLAARDGDVLVQRAGLIAGPHDPTDRLTYWATRMRRPGAVLAPFVPRQPVQVVDARDIASWTLEAAERGVTGVMNVNGPRGATDFAGLLATCGDAEVAWVEEDALLDAGVAPWTELPVWLPERWGATGMLDMDVTRATAAGLRSRPLDETVADVAAWSENDPVRAAADYGTRARSRVLTSAREAVLLNELARVR